MKITSLREHPRKPGRYEIELSAPAGDQPSSSVIRPSAPLPSSVFRPDAATKLTISVELIAELKLKPKQTLTCAEYQRLAQGARAVACYDKALATLGARARSTADLRRYLRTKEFTDAEIAPVLEKLSALGLLDDRAYARTFARTRLAPSRGFGPRRVAAELAKKGVARSLVDAVLAELAEERAADAENAEARGEAPRSAVREAAEKKLRSLAKLAPEVQRRRLYGYLARRGFGGGEIASVLREIVAPGEAGRSRTEDRGGKAKMGGRRGEGTREE